MNYDVYAPTVTTLIDALTQANARSAGDHTTIRLTSNNIYTLTEVDSSTDGPNGLPSVGREVTIIGNGATIHRDSGGPSFRLFHVASAGDLELHGLTVSGGYLGEAGAAGGGAFNKGSLTLVQCVVVGNEAAAYGGGIDNFGSTAHLVAKNSVISKNSANSAGGGIHNIDGRVEVSKSVIIANFSSDGGGIETIGGYVDVTDCLFVGNEAVKGGGINSQNALEVTVVGSTFTNNTILDGAAPNGAAFYRRGVYGGPTTINNCRLFGNSIGDVPISVYNENTNHIDATGNWWGATDGPSGEGPGSGDAVGMRVDFDDFLTTDKIAHDGWAACPICHGADDTAVSGNPISLRKGEKRLEATDLTVNTPAGPLSFTRYYRQSQQETADFQFMGLGWIHNHAVSVDDSTPGELGVRLPNGGLAWFEQDGTSNIYNGKPGSTAQIEVDTGSSEARYTLTAMDRSIYVFDDQGRLRSHSWPSGEVWAYTYYTSGHAIGKLQEVDDGYGRKLQFAYRNNTGGYDDLQLWRVGDHATAGLDSSPTGRYVEFTYITTKVAGNPVGNPPDALLADVRDVRDQHWTYDYYGQDGGESDSKLLNFLLDRQSPLVDTTGNDNPDSEIMLEQLTYLYDQSAELVVDGDMDEVDTWPGIFGAGPATNEQADVRFYGASGFSRHVHDTQAGKGIASNTWYLVAGRTYTITAQVYRESGQVRMQVPGEATTDETSGTPPGQWEMLSLTLSPGVDKPYRNLQFVTAGGGAEFYVDAVSIVEENSAVSRIEQQRGILSSTAALRETTFDFGHNDGRMTTETVDGQTTIHRFERDVYAGTDDPAGNASTRSANDQFRPAIQTDANGNRTWLNWDDTGKHLDKVVDAVGQETSFAYTVDDTLDYSLDAEGRKTEYAYDDLNVPRQPTTSKVLDADETVLRWQRFTYDAKGRVTKEETLDPESGTPLDSETVDRTYYADDDDSVGSRGLLKQVSQHEKMTTYLYDSAGRVVQTNQNTMFGSCTKSRTWYDEAGNVLATVCNYEHDGDPPAFEDLLKSPAEGGLDLSDPTRNLVTTHAYDAMGRQVETTAHAGRADLVTRTIYDALDRVVRTVQNPNTTSVDDNMALWVWEVSAGCWQDQAGPTGVQIPHGTQNNENLINDTIYNARGLVQKRIDTLGNHTLLGYDAASRLVKTVQYASQPAYDMAADPELSSYQAASDADQDLITENVYDAAGNLVQTTDPLGNVSFTVYDALNRPVKTVRNAKATATLAFDPEDDDYEAANDPRSEDYGPLDDPDRDLIELTEYDTLGRVRRTRDVLGSWTLQGYDGLGRQVRVIRQASVPDYPVVDADPGQTQFHDPDLSEYPLSTSADQDIVTDTVYDVEGRVLYTQDVLGRQTRSVYDAQGRQKLSIQNFDGLYPALVVAMDTTNPAATEIVTLHEDGTAPRRLTYNKQLTNHFPSWSPDGRQILFRRTLSQDDLYVIDADGRHEQLLGEGTDQGWSPDGSRIAFMRDARIYTIGADGTSSRALTDTNGDDRSPVWLPVEVGQEQIVAFFSNRNGAWRIHTVPDSDTPGTPSLADSVVVDQSSDLAASPVANKLAFVDSNNQLSLLDLDQAQGAQVLDTAVNASIQPVWSPDGSQIAYQKSQEICVINVDGTGQLQLTQGAKDNEYPTWSPDGGWIAFHSSDGFGASDGIYLVEVKQSPDTPVLVVAGGNYPHWLPSGVVLSPPEVWGWNETAGRWQDDNGLPVPQGTQDDRNIIAETGYDESGRVLLTRDSLGNVTLYGYDELGRQIKVVRNASDPDYDNSEIGSGDPSLEDYAGDNPDPDQDIFSDTTYDALGRVDYTVDHAGNKTCYAYDVLGRRTLTVQNCRTELVNADVSQWLWNEATGQWEDGNGQVIPHEADNAENLMTATTYDVAGRAVAVRGVTGVETQYEYDRAGRRRVITQAASAPSSSQDWTNYDKAGRVLRVIRNCTYDPAVDPHPDVRDGQGNWQYAPQEHGEFADQDLITSYEFDAAGRQTKVIDPLGNETTTDYAKDGQVLVKTDPLAHETWHVYDGLRRLTRVVQNYDPTGLTNPDPAAWVYVTDHWQDGVGNPVSHGTEHDHNIIVEVALDKAGRRTALTDPRGNSTTYAHDLLNRRTQLTNPLSKTWETRYGNRAAGVGTQVELVMPAGFPFGETTRRAFDRLGRLMAINYLEESPQQTPDVGFVYDDAGNRTQMSEVDAGGTVRETHYDYDVARRLTEVQFDTDGDGQSEQTVTYAYDVRGLRTQLTLPGSLAVTYAYDEKGQLVRLTDWDDQTAWYAYDQASRLVGLQRPAFKSVYRYDAGGRLRQLRHGSGSKTLGHFAYEVDALGNRTRALEAVPHASGGPTTLAYDDVSIVYRGTWTDDAVNGFKETGQFGDALTVLVFGDAVTLTLGVGPDHGLCEVYVNNTFWRGIDNYAATAGEQSVTISMENDGPHLLEIRNKAEHHLASSGFVLRFKQLVMSGAYDLHTIAYGYDALSRLIDADYYPGANLAANPFRAYDYAYDLAGNRTQRQVTVNGTPITTNYTYNAANQLVSDGVNTLTYDDNGNLTSDGVNAYTWDRANRLLGTDDGSVTVDNLYNGLGQRVEQTVNQGSGDVVSEFLLDVQPGLWKVLAATASGQTIRYLHGPRGIQAQQNPDGAWRWMVQDGLGSVRGVVNGALTPQESRLYAPYGEPYGTTGQDETTFGFTGEQVDANELVYLRARQYSPGLGVFASLDPVEGMIQRAMSLNGYSWVEGNVPNDTDPSGLLGERPEHYAACQTMGNFDCQYPFEPSMVRPYVICRVANRQNPCPETSEWHFTGILYANMPVCQHARSARNYTPEEAWGLTLHYTDIVSRRDLVLMYALMLRDRVVLSQNPGMSGFGLSDFELLAQVADYSCSFPGTSAQDVADDLSWIFAGASGPLSLAEAAVEAILAGEPIPPIDDGMPQSPFGNSRNPAGSGLHSDYEDNQVQLFHFVPYVASSAHGATPLADFGNVVHEHYGIPDFATGSSWQDDNLANAGMWLGIEISFGRIGACEIGDWIRTHLSQPYPFNNTPNPNSYPWISFCRILVQLGIPIPEQFGTCNPSVPYP